MTGRPPTPIARKRLTGDTRQRGANRHAAALAAAYEAPRGCPSMPLALARAPKGADPAERKLYKMAREHWSYLAEQLTSERLLTKLDEGMLTGLALTYARMVTAALAGRDQVHILHFGNYMRAADRMGLNESARARLPKPAGAPKPKSLDDELCA